MYIEGVENRTINLLRIPHPTPNGPLWILSSDRITEEQSEQVSGQCRKVILQESVVGVKAEFKLLVFQANAVTIGTFCLLL